MKSYVITIKHLPQSVESAQRCIDSMPEYNVQMFGAITPADEPITIAKKEGVPTDGFKEKFSHYENCLSAFLSHYSLWKKCVEDNEEYQIFEHDAVCVDSIPKLINYQGCISLGQPSYGKYIQPSSLGVNRLTSKKYFPGAHAYRLKPKGARKLIESAQLYARPTDVFLNLDLFPWLEEYYPWPVVAKDSFTTIQRQEGCLAKHNYGENYDILR